ncbi:MAG TPA: 30S ribosomal protein S6 [Candidatus Babeliales bacterium]|nr:30S ribosomal protein S6 [Candidatus Babeliales bacterium]
MLRQYEALLLTVPEITGDEVKYLETQLDKTIKAGTGSTISFERWGKYRLAYEINKNEYGIFFLMRFEVPQGTTLINDMKTLLKVKLNNVIMRDMISVLNPKHPLTYQRPRSLEEAPTRESESLSRDHKSSHFFSMDDRDNMDED